MVTRVLSRALNHIQGRLRNVVIRASSITDAAMHASITVAAMQARITAAAMQASITAALRRSRRVRVPALGLRGRRVSL